MSDPVKMAKAAWGDALPEWVLVLAQACKQSSQRKVAAKLDRSGALVNQVLKHKYNGDLSAVKELVSGVFMNGTLACPALGNIPTHECHAWRTKARKFSNANMLRVQMYRACNGCARHVKGHYHD